MASSKDTEPSQQPNREVRKSDFTKNGLIAAVIAVTGLLLMAISHQDTLKKMNWDAPTAQIGLGLLLAGITFFLIDQQLDEENRKYTRQRLLRGQSSPD